VFPVFVSVSYNTQDIVHITVATVLGARMTWNMAYEHVKVTHIIFYTSESPPFISCTILTVFASDEV
jgi:hypothetical protein